MLLGMRGAYLAVFAVLVGQGDQGLEGCPALTGENRRSLKEYLRQFRPGG